MIKTIDHIGIITHDLQQSVEFYTDVLGFSISAKIEMDDVGLSAIFIEKNGSRIELMGYKGAIPKRSEGIEIKFIGHRLSPPVIPESISIDMGIKCLT